MQLYDTKPLKSVYYTPVVLYPVYLATISFCPPFHVRRSPYQFPLIRYVRETERENETFIRLYLRDGTHVCSIETPRRSPARYIVLRTCYNIACHCYGHVHRLTVGDISLWILHISENPSRAEQSSRTDVGKQTICVGEYKTTDFSIYYNIIIYRIICLCMWFVYTHYIMFFFIIATLFFGVTLGPHTCNDIMDMFIGVLFPSAKKLLNRFRRPRTFRC